jgi:hypothetical protein
MSNPYVVNVAFIKNQIVLAIQVDDYPVGEVLEISGYATQSNGALAVFNDIKPVPARNQDGTDYMYVKAFPSPPKQFMKGHAVTVVLRASRVWTTVLGEPQPEQEQLGGHVREVAGQDQQGEAAEEGTRWSVVRVEAYAAPLPEGDAGQPPAGGGANFPGGA